MTRNLHLRGLGACAQEAYLRAVRQLAAFYRPTPNQFNEEQLREYFLRHKNHSTYSLDQRINYIDAVAIAFRHETPIGQGDDRQS